MSSSVLAVHSVARAGALAAGFAARQAERIPLVYILSATHSGSTLLTAQLARHPDVCTVGELSGTPYRAEPGYRCSCGAQLRECGFWQKVSEAMLKRGFSYAATTDETDVRNALNPLVRRLLKPLHRGPLLELVRDTALLLCPGGLAHIRRQQRLKAALVESIVEATGKPILVDSSKAGMQLKYHLRNPRLDVRVIWLLRDGRGAALSLVRNARIPMQRAAHQWRRSVEEARAIVRRLDPSRYMQVRYEGLCTDPDETLARVWGFMDGPPSHPHGDSAAEQHILGHRTRLGAVGAIKLDEKWRTQLSPTDLQTFDSVAGQLNRELGYR